MKDQLRISNIQIHPIRALNGLVGFASFEMFDSIRCDGIAIYTSPTHSLNYRLVFPAKKLASGKQVSFFYPFRQEVEEIITKTIVNKYIDLMQNFHHVESY